MAKLHFEVDTEDIFSDYDEEYGRGGSSFEDLVRESLGDKVKQEVIKTTLGEKLISASKIIALESVYQVEKKISNLINEDIVIPDRWGKPIFIGSVEDYIKKQIDEKLLRPVDTEGKTLKGVCSTNEDSWIEYMIKKMITHELNKIRREVESVATKFCNSVLDKKMTEFKEKTLIGLIVKKLDSIGVSV